MKRVVDPLVSAVSLAPWWSTLFEASGRGSVFLSPAWTQTWIEHYGAAFDGQWVRWEVDGRVVAGGLLLERKVPVKGLPLRTLYLNATGDAPVPTPFPEYNDLLCVPGHEAAVLDDLAAWLRSRAWSRLRLCGHEAGSVAEGVLLRLPGRSIERDCKPSRYVNLQQLGERPFETAVPGKAGTHVRRNLREYRERLGDLQVTRPQSLPDALQAFEAMRQLHLARWKDRVETTTLSDAGVVAFHRTLIERLWPTGQVEVLRVGSATEAIGYLYNFIVGGKVFVFQTGFAYEASSKWSPGLLTHTLAIEYYRARGLREYDLLSGDALYKRTLANGVRDLYWTVLYRDTAWIRALLAARKLRDRLAKKSAPSPLEAVTPPGNAG